MQKKKQKKQKPKTNNKIKKEYKEAWLQYEECAFGQDVLNPLRCVGNDDGFNMGLT